MATDFWASGYDNWDADEQQLFDSLVDAIGNPALYDDAILQSYVDVLYNVAQGDEMPRGDIREAFEEALNDYMYDAYGYSFDELWDWEAWREAYSDA